MSFNLSGTSDGSEISASHCIHPKAVQPSVGNAGIPLKTFPAWISPDFSLPDYFRGSFQPLTGLSFWLFCTAIFNFLELCTKHCLGRGTALIQSMLLPTVLENADWVLVWSVLIFFYKYKQLKVDYKCDLNCWPSLAPRSFDRNMYTEFNSIKVRTIPLFHIAFL